MEAVNCGFQGECGLRDLAGICGRRKVTMLRERQGVAEAMQVDHDALSSCGGCLECIGHFTL
jgi:hypothetical protein